MKLRTLSFLGSDQMDNLPKRLHPFCNGPDDVKPPDERHAAELMLLSVVNAWPPHHAVRGSGEPI
jgi:hypothetical protein